MARTKVEWVAQVSLLRPGPPTQSLEFAVVFRQSEAYWRDLRFHPRADLLSEDF
jgi:hypothetical protein